MRKKHKRTKLVLLQITIDDDFPVDRKQVECVVTANVVDRMLMWLRKRCRPHTVNISSGDVPICIDISQEDYAELFGSNILTDVEYSNTNTIMFLPDRVDCKQDVLI